MFFNIYYNYCANALRGIGLINQYQKIVVFARIVQIIVSFIGIYSGLGLIALCIAYLVSGFIIRICSKFYLDLAITKATKNMNSGDTVAKETFKSKVKEAYKLFVSVWHNAKKSGMISLCSYATNQSLTLICSAYLGVEETASYGLCLQIISSIMSIAGILFSTYSPKMINSMALNRGSEYNKVFSMCITIFWIIGICGIFGFAILANPILTLLGSNTSVPIFMFLFMGVYMFLEHNHGEFTAYFTMRNSIIYLKSYIISSICIVVFSWGLAYLGLNIYALMFVHFIVQICYNNWYWPNKAMILMGLSYRQMFKDGILEIYTLVKTMFKK